MATEDNPKATVEKPSAGQDQADLEEICRLAAEGKRVTDSDILKWIRDRSARVREEAMRRFGVRSIGVEIIRGLRAGN